MTATGASPDTGTPAPRPESVGSPPGYTRGGFSPPADGDDESRGSSDDESGGEGTGDDSTGDGDGGGSSENGTDQDSGDDGDDPWVPPVFPTDFDADGDGEIDYAELITAIDAYPPEPWPPVAHQRNYTFASDQTLSGGASGRLVILSGQSRDRTVVAYEVVSAPAHGALNVFPVASDSDWRGNRVFYFTYDWSGAHPGTDVFRYRVADDLGQWSLPVECAITIEDDPASKPRTFTVDGIAALYNLTLQTLRPGDLILCQAGSAGAWQCTRDDTSPWFATKLYGNLGTAAGPITLRNYPGDEIHLEQVGVDGDPPTYVYHGIAVTASGAPPAAYIVIEGLRISGFHEVGITAADTNGTDITIRNCVIFSNRTGGIQMGGSFARVQNCRIFDNGYEVDGEPQNVDGIKVSPGSDYCLLEYNEISGHPGGNGIDCAQPMMQAVLRYNVLYDNLFGAFGKQGCSDFRMYGNVAYGNTYVGILLGGTTWYAWNLYSCRDSQAYFNTCYNNGEDDVTSLRADLGACNALNAEFFGNVVFSTTEFGRSFDYKPLLCSDAKMQPGDNNRFGEPYLDNYASKDVWFHHNVVFKADCLKDEATPPWFSEGLVYEDPLLFERTDWVPVEDVARLERVALLYLRYGALGNVFPADIQDIQAGFDPRVVRESEFIDDGSKQLFELPDENAPTVTVVVPEDGGGEVVLEPDLSGMYEFTVAGDGPHTFRMIPSPQGATITMRAAVCDYQTGSKPVFADNVFVWYPVDEYSVVCEFIVSYEGLSRQVYVRCHKSE